MNEKQGDQHEKRTNRQIIAHSIISLLTITTQNSIRLTEHVKIRLQKRLPQKDPGTVRK